MTIDKIAADRVSLRGGVWYYIRRVPKALSSIESRTLIRISLKTSDKVQAYAQAESVERALDSLWASETGQNDDALKRYQAAVERAQLEGFAYNALPDLAKKQITDLISRLEALGDRISSSKIADALLGGANKPTLVLSESLERYYNFTKAELIGKRPDQIRRWKNARELAVKNLITVLGEDRPVQNLTRADARLFRDWWLERIRKEGLGRNAANKQISHLSHILSVVNEEMTLDLEPIFAKLSISESKKTRPPLSRTHVENVLLAPGALAALNIEARCALLLCVETGMGTEEVCSLLPEHINLGSTIPHVSIVSREGAEQKTEYRPREIPLVGVSLLAAYACPEGFPRYRGRPASLSALINKYLRGNHLLPSKEPSLYSLRHSFQDRMIEVEVPERLQAELMGHKLHRERYGKGGTLEHKQKWLQKMVYKLSPEFTI